MDYQKFTNISCQNAFEITSGSILGLSFKQASSRLKNDGKNIIPSELITWDKIFLNQFKSSFVFLLIFVVIASFYLGEIFNALMIILFLIINISLGFFQEYRSNQAIKTLSKIISSHIMVRRDGEEIAINVQDLVKGDIVFLEPGLIVPADLYIYSSDNLYIDESSLTGEAIPVNKIPFTKKNSDKNCEHLAFAGTRVMSGKATALVIATGKNMRISAIGKLTEQTKKTSTFQKEIDKISRFILWLTLITLAVILSADLIINPEQDFTSHLIFAIVLAVGVIPEALPVVTTFALSKGSLALAKNKVVVKRLSAVEDLGTMEVLCTDKTGTLTENKMTVSNIFADDIDMTLFYGALSAEHNQGTNEKMDSFSAAIFNRLTTDQKKKLKEYEVLDSYAFDPQRQLNSVLIKSGKKQEIIIKGAPEKILESIESKEQKYVKLINNWINQEGKKGKRIIALAKRDFEKTKYKETDEQEKIFKLVGFISFIDPIKKTAIEAIKKSKNLGVQIKIITGDRPEVAETVGREIGLINGDEQVLTGDQLAKMSEAQKKAAIDSAGVFARISPEQKHEIVSILQSKYETGFLGDGINDAPALKAANIGLAVKEATQIARESADIIILQKDLNVIIDGIKAGREIFANINKYITATLASNFGNFYAVSIASLFIDYLPILPLQILLINLLSDFPMIAMATDSVEPEMIKKPGRYNIKEIGMISVIFGLLSSVFDFIFFVIFVRFSAVILQTGWFIESIVTELCFIFLIRSRKSVFKAKTPSIVLLLLTIFAALLTFILPFTDFGRNVFGFANLSMKHLIIIIVIIFGYITATELTKIIYFKTRLENSNKK